MGLDMYLYARKEKYVSSFRSETKYPKELEEYGYEIQERNFKSISTKIDYQIGYWRKFNALHNWIIGHCTENGEDNCQPIYIDDVKLRQLQTIVNQVLEDHSKAKDLLPTCSGFFFGTTNYDEWYYEDLKYTKNLLENILKDKINEKFRIVYRASW